MCSHISACASLTWDLAKKCALRELAQACMSARRLFTLVKSPFHLHWPSVTSLVFPLKRPGTGPLLVMGNLPLLSHWTLPHSIIQTHIAANLDLNFNFLMNKWRLPLTVTGNVSFFPFLCGLTESCLHIQIFAAIEFTDIKCGQAANSWFRSVSVVSYCCRWFAFDCFSNVGMVIPLMNTGLQNFHISIKEKISINTGFQAKRKDN